MATAPDSVGAGELSVSGLFDCFLSANLQGPWAHSYWATGWGPHWGPRWGQINRDLGHTTTGQQAGATLGANQQGPWAHSYWATDWGARWGRINGDPGYLARTS